MGSLDYSKCCFAFPKPTRTRVKGKALLELNREIHKRDGHTCIIKGCGRFVSDGEKFHHVILKSQGGSDSVKNGVTLCLSCHTEAHGKDGREVLMECREYIKSLYGEVEG